MNALAPVFILGTARSGSTALAEFVSTSLGLELVRGKESHFLAANGMPERSGGPDGPRFDRLRDKSISEFYSRLSTQNDGAFLDASSSSLYYASASAETLTEHFPNAKLIAVLRDPIDRAESAHRYMTARGLERLPIDAALRDESRRISQGWPHIWHYASAGLYADQVAALGGWRKKTLFLLYERDLRSEDLLNKIAAHTGYPIMKDEPLLTRNEARSFAVPAIGRGAEWLRSHRLVNAAPPWIRKRGRTFVDRFRAPYKSDTDPAVKEMLKVIYQEDVARLGSLTGLNVDCWLERI